MQTDSTKQNFFERTKHEWEITTRGSKITLATLAVIIDFVAGVKVIHQFGEHHYGAGAAEISIGIGSFLMRIVAPFLIAANARKRGFSFIQWLLVTTFLGPVGMLIYYFRHGSRPFPKENDIDYPADADLRSFIGMPRTTE